MSRSPRRVGATARLIAALLACLTLLGLGWAAAASAAPIGFGLSDQEARTFFDPRVKELGVRYARDVLPWNVALKPAELAVATEWLTAVHQHRISPLITFEHATGRRGAPTHRQFRKAFLRFRRLFPWVREYTPWNEATHDTQPTWHRPELAAMYYDIIVNNCRGCLVTAPDTLDADGNIEAWIQVFLKTAHPRPRIWPINPYVSVSRGNPAKLFAFLNAVHGQVWFSEIGGIVWWRFRGRLIYRGAKSAATTAAEIFKMTRISNRISRVYYYHWRSPGSPCKVPKTVTWDAGLLNANGTARAALFVIAKALHRRVQSGVPSSVAAAQSARAARRRSSPHARVARRRQAAIPECIRLRNAKRHRRKHR